MRSNIAGGRVIVCGGRDNNGNDLSTCWSYDPAEDSWTEDGRWVLPLPFIFFAYVHRVGMEAMKGLSFLAFFLPVLGGPKEARKHNLSIASIPVCLQGRSK